MARLPVDRVSTYGFAIGRSRIGLSRISDDEGAALIERLKAGNPDNIEDAVIAATAWKDGATYVSAETRGGAVKRARREGIAAKFVHEFAAHVRALPATP